MNTVFSESFDRDLKKLKNPKLRERVARIIESVEKAQILSEIAHLKKIKGAENHYRLRLGNYRLGIVIEGDTVEFVRCLHRKEIYRFFP